MSTSVSFDTPKTSFSASEFSINRNQDDEHQSGLFHSVAVSVLQRARTTSSIHLSSITTDNSRNAVHNDSSDHHTDDEDHMLILHYDVNRKKQQKLLLLTNIFRLLVIFILAPIIYFLV